MGHDEWQRQWDAAFVFARALGMSETQAEEYAREAMRGVSRIMGG